MKNTFVACFLALIALTEMAVGEVCFSGSSEARLGEDCYSWPDNAKEQLIIEKGQIVKQQRRTTWMGQDFYSMGEAETNSSVPRDILRSMGEPVDAP